MDQMEEDPVVADHQQRRRAAFSKGSGRGVAAPLSAVHRVSGGAPIIDSSKSPLYAWLLQREQSIRWDFVHLIRDSRAVAFSHQRTRRDPSARDERFLRKAGPITSAAEWSSRNTLAAALSSSSHRYVRTV
jgi:hypothetical protein